MLRNVDENVAAPSFPGQRAGDAGRGDARKRADASEKLFEEGHLLRRLVVVRVGKGELHGEDVVGGGAEVTGAELLIALEQQTSTEQEHDGERDLRGEKSFA